MSAILVSIRIWSPWSAALHRRDGCRELSKASHDRCGWMNDFYVRHDTATLTMTLAEVRGAVTSTEDWK